MTSKPQRDKPILFSGAMIRAILAGTKTQTRRILKDAPTGDGWHCDRTATGLRWVASAGAPSMPVRLRWGAGDALWVREAFSYDRNSIIRNGDHHSYLEESPIWHWADGNPPDGDWTKPKPSIHMPRWASRITLEVIGVHIEQLQDISEADAVAEGVTPDCPIGYIPAHARAPHRYCFAHLWESINGEGAWAANPFVVAVEFRRMTLPDPNAANEPAPTTDSVDPLRIDPDDLVEF